MEYRSSVATLAGAERPTYEQLVKHAKLYGLSQKPGYRGKVSRYSSYKTLAADPLVQVAFDFFGETTYVSLIEALGYGEFATQARADWRDARGLEPSDE